MHVSVRTKYTLHDHTYSRMQSSSVAKMLHEWHMDGLMLTQVEVGYQVVRRAAQMEYIRRAGTWHSLFRTLRVTVDLFPKDERKEDVNNNQTK